MVSKFGKSSSGFANKGEREKFLFIAAAGTALAVVVIFILVAGARSGGQGGPTQAMNEEPPVATMGKESVAVIAPESEVPPGTPLAQVKFKKMYWPRTTAPEGAFTEISEVAGLYAKTKLLPGLPLVRKDTSTTEQTPNVNTIALTPGNRAVTIEVDDTSGLEGHALPGTHVDVVLTYTQSGNLVSNIIVQNARVLSYGGDVTSASVSMRERRPSRVARTMTLDVATQDALKIQTARQMGRLSLIMRAAEDDAAASSTNFTASDLANAGKAAKPAPQAVCSKGRIKMGGKEYIVGCDGSMSAVQ